MFNLRKRVENLENQLKIDPVVITEEDLYKFYLQRRIDEINARSTNKIKYHITETTILSFFYLPGINIEIHIGNIKLFDKVLSLYDLNCIDKNISIAEYKTILEYLNKKSIGYFIKLDKKIEDLKKHNKELDDKKLNLEEELKKII